MLEEGMSQKSGGEQEGDSILVIQYSFVWIDDWRFIESFPFCRLYGAI